MRNVASGGPRNIRHNVSIRSHIPAELKIPEYCWVSIDKRFDVFIAQSFRRLATSSYFLVGACQTETHPSRRRPLLPIEHSKRKEKEKGENVCACVQWIGCCSTRAAGAKIKDQESPFSLACSPLFGGPTPEPTVLKGRPAPRH